jgi:hypothetical protein
LSLPSDARKTDICDRKTNIESAKLKYNTHIQTIVLYYVDKYRILRTSLTSRRVVLM